MKAALKQFCGAAAGSGGFDHATFSRLLGIYVSRDADGLNRVDYAAWKAAPTDLADLDGYIARLQAESPARLTRDEQFVFWINLYNAETLRVVLAAYPVRSILFIRPGMFSIGPWRARTLRVNGRRLSLSDIENRILRPGFGDPRVHFALNCASTGCPVLRPVAWTAFNLDAELDAAARELINGPRGARVKGGKLVLSTIFKWYRRDFGKTHAQMLDHLATYAEPHVANQLRQANPRLRYAYDWSLIGKKG